MPLSKIELTDLRDKLLKAEVLISGVRDTYLAAGGYVEDARLLNEIAHLLADEIAALKKGIATKLVRRA